LDKEKTPTDSGEGGSADGDNDLFAEPESAEAPRKRVLFRRHPVLMSVATLVLLAAGVVLGFVLYLNSLLGDIDKVTIGELPDNQRPAAVDSEAVNILLAGVDKGDGRTITEIQEGGWDPGVLRSDTIMIVHVTADREHAYLISVPRDSYARLYDDAGQPQGVDKINAAFSLYGPTAYIATIENLTGLRMEHLAVVDWAGFEDITNALGGVEVYIPETFYDNKQKREWKQGNQVLDGEDALAYVRTRYDLPGGDFGRIDRQQNFIRSLMSKLLSGGTLTNPFTFTPTLRAVVANLTVDDGFDTGEIRSLALSLRNLRSNDVTFLTAPFGRFDTTSAGASIVRLDPRQSNELWQAVEEETIEQYLDKYGKDAGSLPGPRGVS